VRALLQLPRFLKAYTLRTAVVWIGVRVALAFGGVANPGLVIEIALLPVVATVVLLDARRRGEDVFLGNLGIPAWSIAGVVVPIAALLETLVP